MSAGGLLEIPAFMVGLCGIIALAEKGFRLWQLITDCQYFGEDLVKTMCKLSFEYALFHAWCEGVGITPTTAGASSLLRPTPSRSGSGPSSFQDELYDASRSPFYIAVSQIVDTLGEIQKITTKLQSLAADHGVEKGLVGAATQGALAATLPKAALPIWVRWQKKSQERGFNRISFFRRAGLQIATSEALSEREQLDALIGRFAEWNRKLWDFLSSAVKDAIITKYLPVTVFDIPFHRQDLGVLREAARERFPSISNTAHLWMEKEQIESAPDESICPPVSASELRLSATRAGPWQLATFGDVNSRRVLVEWYEYQNLTEAQTTASTNRISKLSQITRLAPGLSELRTLASPGYVCIPDSNGLKLGLLFDFPAGADPTRTPTSLASLFTKDKSKRSPKEVSLRQKFILANQLATSLAAFHRVRWYHKNFTAASVVFFYSRADRTLLLSHPYISGFGFARPDDPAGLSLNPDWEMHIHPELQHDEDPARPKFQRRHDIYSLGVMLFDIGTWGAAELYLWRSGVKVRPEEFRLRLERYAMDLRGRMGVEYMQVTRWCLCQTEEGAETQIALETFYWRVLRELESCHCSATVGA